MWDCARRCGDAFCRSHGHGGQLRVWVVVVGGWGKRNDSIDGVESIRIYTRDSDKETGHIIARERVQVGKEDQQETHMRCRQSQTKVPTCDT
jgi:hypothetical protein